MLAKRFKVVIPLLFMLIGLGALVWSEREFQRRADRDNAELRLDLKEAGISRAEFAALLSAQTKMQANASSLTESSVFVAFIVSIFSVIPLYAKIASDRGEESDG